jgi:response regulator RpfG family c-di-GMP phosphodiesterase
MPGHFDPQVLDAFIRIAPEFDNIFATCQDE